MAAVFGLPSLAEATSSEEAARKFLQDKNLLPARENQPNCPEPGCKRKMTWVSIGSGRHCFRCPSHKGRKRNAKTGTFFAHSHLTYRQSIWLVYCWAHGKPVSQQQVLLEGQVGYYAVVHWNKFFRSICSRQLLEDNCKIGGRGVVVQIAETSLVKRNPHRGSAPPKKCIFRAFCPAQQLGFLAAVENNSAETLLPLLVRNVEPGSVIQSGVAEGYEGIEALKVDPPFAHETVVKNRSQQKLMDDPAGAGANSVRNIDHYWNNCKRIFRELHWAYSDMTPSHFDELMWREKYGEKFTQAFHSMLSHIAHFYPSNVSTPAEATSVEKE